jgi:hypothetical protein
MTLFAFQSVTWTISGAGVIRIIWLRLVHKCWSKVGFALWLSPPFIGITALSDITPQVYPVLLDDTSASQLLNKVEQLQPGLVARLRAGERPILPDLHGARVTIDGAGVHRQNGVPIDVVLLGDKGTIEGLRFALAQRAFSRGDRDELLRLLPLELPRTPVDLPARNAFARRLEHMEQFSGGPVVVKSERAELAHRIAAWHAVFDASKSARPLMQIIFLSGMACWLLSRRLRKRIRRLEAARVTLATTSEPRPQLRTFGRRTAATVPATEH